MPSNAEIRTINFAQGINVTSANVVDDVGEKIIINNAANQSTGLTFSDLLYREIIITYSIRRRTDDTALAGDLLLEGGVLKLSANPDAAALADRWILKHTEKEDEGVPVDVAFDIDVTDDGSGNAVVDLQYTSSNLAGANYECYMSYSLTSFLV